MRERCGTSVIIDIAKVDDNISCRSSGKSSEEGRCAGGTDGGASGIDHTPCIALLQEAETLIDCGVFEV